MADDETPRQSIRMLFVGVRRTSQGKRRNAWICLGDRENDGSPLEYESKDVMLYEGKNLCRGVSPGAIITIDKSMAPEDCEEGHNVIFTTTARIADHWDCEYQVAQWQLEHSATTLELDAEGNAAKKNKERADLACLDPIRDLYWRLAPRQRKALLVNVLTYIQGEK